MSEQFILSLTADDVEQRLLKVAELDIFNATYSDNVINVAVNYLIKNGSEVKFRTPAEYGSDAESTLLCVQYPNPDSPDESLSNTFAFADANGNDIGEVNNLFGADAIVKVILDIPDDVTSKVIKTKNANGEIVKQSLQDLGLNGVAFVQNADTNQYLEDKFEAVGSRIKAVEEVTNSIDDTIANATQNMVTLDQDPANQGKVLTINAEGKVVPDDINAFYTDEEDTNPSTTPLNADTLGGNPASYFATKTDLSQYATKEDLNDVSGSGETESGVISINGKKGVVALTATDVNALPSTGGTVTGAVTFNGIILKEGVDFGSTLPSTAQVGQIFFLEVDD